MGVMSNEEALLKELDSDIADAYSSGTLNNKVDIALSFATVVTSLIPDAVGPRPCGRASCSARIGAECRSMRQDPSGLPTFLQVLYSCLSPDF